MGPNFYLRSLLLLPLPLFLHAQERVSDGLMSLYTFHEGGGQFIQDVSGVGSPLLLSINDPTTVEWIPGGGINVQQTSLIQSLANANKIGEACQISNEISLEMWVVPANSTQDGPCRMMTISNGINDRNCMLGQKNSRFISRVRTTSTNANGIPNLETSSNTASPVLQHIVYTLAANGEEKMYVNNALVASGTRLGTFDNWNLNSETALISALNNWLSLKASYVIKYDNDPVDALKKADKILGVALVANF